MRVSFGTDGVLESVEIDASLMLTEEQLEETFSVSFAAAPVPQCVVSTLVSNPALMRQLREGPPEMMSVHAGAGGVVTLRSRLGRPIRVVLSPNGLVRMTYDEVAAEVVQLARLAADEGVHT